jgi:hypothetical protein
MGIAIAGKSIKDGDSIAIQGILPSGIAIQGKIVYTKEAPPPPAPVITSTSHAYVYYYITWDQIQFYGSNFRDTDILVMEGIDHSIVFVSDTRIHSSSTSQIGYPMGRTVPVYVRSVDGQVSNTINITVQVSPE